MIVFGEDSKHSLLHTDFFFVQCLTQKKRSLLLSLNVSMVKINVSEFAVTSYILSWENSMQLLYFIHFVIG